MFKKIFTTAAISLLSVGCTSTHAESRFTGPAIPVVGFSNPENVQELEVVEKEWKCPSCNKNEQYVLGKLQSDAKITDKNALATVMGNIKQESGFVPNICEGGARVPYNRCHRGGYGLIQWTTTTRYNNLGRFCKKYKCDPSTIEGQTRFMINEVQFQKLLPEFRNPGFRVSQYMVPSYYWLGWGIEGDRRMYSYNYAKRLVWA